MTKDASEGAGIVSEFVSFLVAPNLSVSWTPIQGDL